MPIQQTKRFYIESVVLLATCPRQSANRLNLQLGISIRKNPVTPGQAGGPVGLGYSGRTTRAAWNQSVARKARSSFGGSTGAISLNRGQPLSSMADFDSNYGDGANLGKPPGPAVTRAAAHLARHRTQGPLDF